jgi:translation initiation factor 1 (eIF-1/SUI1)
MLKTYKATLRGDKIEWATDIPKVLRNDKSVAVYVTIIDGNDVSDVSNGKKMAEVLKKMASKGGVSSIENASEWQREQRAERNLAEREN